MYSVYMDSSASRRSITRALGRASQRAPYGALAPLRGRRIPETPLPGLGWVRVRNHIAGISEDDLAIVHQQTSPHVSVAAMPRPRRQYLGSEVVGDVIEVGPEVEFLQPGDRVAYQFDQHCATRDIDPPCRYCASGNYNLCENRYLPNFPAVGGGWSEEMIMHERQLFLVPKGIPDEQAALLKPVANCVHAALRRLPHPGEQALIYGTGATGLLLIQTIRALAPNAAVAALPTHPYQVEHSTRMGAARTLFPEEGAAGVVRLTGAKRYHQGDAELLTGGFDVIFDTLGSEESLRNSLRWVRAGGTVVMVANERRVQQVDLTPIWHHETRLIGSIGHGVEKRPDGTSGERIETFALAANLLRERRITPERLVTHRFPLREVRHALEMLQHPEQHEAIKVLLDISAAATIAAPAGWLPAQ